MTRELTGWKHDLGTLLIGADTLWGGDHKAESGGDHFISEPWTGGYETPAIYHDDVAVALRSGEDVEPEAIRDFAHRYGLLRASNALHSVRFKLPSLRSNFIVHLSSALNVALGAGLAHHGVGNFTMPSFENRYRAATFRFFDMHGPERDAARLDAALERAGYGEGHLIDRVEAWEHDLGYLPGDQVAGEVKRIMDALEPVVRERLLSPLDGLVTLPEDFAWESLAEIPLDGFEFKSVDMGGKLHVTGSQSYFGGQHANGTPALRGLFEYNENYPMTQLSLIHLALHEALPGHYLHSVLSDTMNDSFESSIATMCSPAVAVWEGVAQNALNFLYDSQDEGRDALATLFDLRREDVDVLFALEDAIDTAKHDGPYLHQVGGLGEDELRSKVREEYGLPAPLDRKIWGWSAHPLIGPMYGSTYLVGRESVSGLINQHGRLAVALNAFNLRGYRDLETIHHGIGQ